MRDEQDLNAFFMDALIKGNFRDASGTYQQSADGFAKILVEKRLFSNSTLSGKPEVEPWLRSRLLESTVAYEGVLRYVDDLLKYNGRKPERDVKINSYLAAVHISFSLNPVVYDTLMRLRHYKRLNLTSYQVNDLSKVLNPSKAFVVPELTESFDPIVVEDIRSGIQRLVWDELAAKKESFKKPRIATSSDVIPSDLVLLGTVPALTAKELIDLSKQFSFFRIIIKDGYLIWNFEGTPTMYVTNNELFYSPSQCRAFSKLDIDEQYKNVMRLLRKATEKKPTCGICSGKEAKEVALTNEGRIMQVCEDCVKSPLVWRVMYSSNPRSR